MPANAIQPLFRVALFATRCHNHKISFLGTHTKVTKLAHTTADLTLGPYLFTPETWGIVASNFRSRCDHLLQTIDEAPDVVCFLQFQQLRIDIVAAVARQKRKYGPTFDKTQFLPDLPSDALPILMLIYVGVPADRFGINIETGGRGDIMHVHYYSPMYWLQ